MPRLDPTDPLVAAVPLSLDFKSHWPSEDTLLDPKLNAMLQEGLGAAAALRAGMTSNWNALRTAFRNKAVVAGDFLARQLAGSAYLNAKGAVQGVFAGIEWGTLDLSGSPEQALAQMAKVAVPAALTALTGIPLVGQLASSYFAAGTRLAQMYIDNRQKTIQEMPWAQYSRESDEDLTKLFVLETYSNMVDQTNLFRPPWTPGADWRLGVSYLPGKKQSPENIRGHVWAPWEGQTESIPYRSDGIGSMPGTIRIFGPIQLPRAGRAFPKELRRTFRTPQGITPREQPFQILPLQVNCGDYYPSAASACGSLWGLIGSNGSPDMYKVHVATLIEEWSLAFETMYASFTDWWEKDNGTALMLSIGELRHAEARRLLGAAIEPWTAMRLLPGLPWTLGLPWDMPSNWSMVTPGVFKGGKPGDPAGRTPSIWIEQDLRNLAKYSDGRLRYPTWPYRHLKRDQLPQQHPCSAYKACSADLAATANMEAILHPASYLDPNGPAPPGYRKQPWPPPEADAAQFSSAYTAIVGPTLERLRTQQKNCLVRTLACAYVRPVTINSELRQYGAFRDEALRAQCLEVREALLTHPARYRVNLSDAEAIDPPFAAKLKASGLTGKPSDFAKALGFTSVQPDAPPPPDNQPPQGGIPFGSLTIPGGPSGPTSGGGSGAGWLALLALAGAGGYFLLNRKGR